MMFVSGILFLIAILVLVLVFLNGNRKPGGRREKPAPPKAADIVGETLEGLGFFDYAPEELRASLANHYQTHYQPDAPLRPFLDQAGLAVDRRMYLNDSPLATTPEAVAAFFDLLHPTLSLVALDLPLHWPKQTDAGTWRLRINRLTYTLSTPTSSADHPRLLVRLAQLLNHELERQMKEDRVYLAGSSPDQVQVLFLSAPQSVFLGQLLKDPGHKPQKPAAWAEALGLAPLGEIAVKARR